MARQELEFTDKPPKVHPWTEGMRPSVDHSIRKGDEKKLAPWMSDRSLLPKKPPGRK